MQVHQLKNLKIALDVEGVQTYTKASYPVRYGRYHQVEYEGYLFLCNLNGEVKIITGGGAEWPHSSEWLQRTIGNDWVYYSAGSYYTGTVDLFGEFYMPCPAYLTNSLFREDPFSLPGVQAALKKQDQMGAYAGNLAKEQNSPGANGPLQTFLTQVGKHSNRCLQQKADALYRILQGRVTVLPPDCRHVDYDVMPVMLAEGCLYNCSFCQVKTGQDFTTRSRENVIGQLQGLKEFFGADLVNRNGVFLGQHDALAAKSDDILFAAGKAYDLLEIDQSYMGNPRLFMFGSADSFLQLNEHFFANLNRLPYYSYINIGLESFDEETLAVLKKPVAVTKMKEAFATMMDINHRYEHIEITANFLLGEELPEGHLGSIIDHLGTLHGYPVGKGCIYFSPLQGSSDSQKLLGQFRDIKRKSRMESLLYLIQRL